MTSTSRFCKGNEAGTDAVMRTSKKINSFGLFDANKGSSDKSVDMTLCGGTLSSKNVKCVGFEYHKMSYRYPDCSSFKFYSASRLSWATRRSVSMSTLKIPKYILEIASQAV